MDGCSTDVTSQTDDSNASFRTPLLIQNTTTNSSLRDDDSIQVEDNNDDGKRDITLVLVGSTGKGKSATGNTILGGKTFVSTLSSSSVTHTCEMGSTLLDGRTIKVIDTQGFCEIVTDHALILEEVTKCFDLANNEIHAFLLVISVRSRFSKEEAATIRNLKILLGSNVVNYVIIVFTGGDDLDDQMKSLDDFLGHDCPDPLKVIIVECGNRCILFDNKTNDQSKKDEQIRQLLSKVDKMVNGNNEKPFKHSLYELQKSNKALLQAYEMAGLNGEDTPMTNKGDDHAKDARTLREWVGHGFSRLIEQARRIVCIVIDFFKRHARTLREWVGRGISRLVEQARRIIDFFKRHTNN